MNKKDKIYIAGHNGLVGRAIVNELGNQGYENLLMKKSSELDLRNQAAVNTFFEKEKPDFVFLAAAKVGGIMANSTMKGDFIYDNLMIASNIIKASRDSEVKKLLNLGSSCIYPKLADQPLKESALLSGYLEPTNEPYAIAKIAAIKLCTSFNHQYGTNFISAMPTNLYGPYDNFNLETSHVLPAMLRKFHEAQVNNTEVELWGDGTPFREFLYSEDLAEGLVFLMNHVDAPQMPEGFLNIGTGEDLSIRDLAALIKKTVGFTGPVKWDDSRPNGTPRKVMDVSAILNLGWKAKTTLEEGLKKVYRWYLQEEAHGIKG